jgi:hypothetical protein
MERDQLASAAGVPRERSSEPQAFRSRTRTRWAESLS